VALSDISSVAVSFAAPGGDQAVGTFSVGGGKVTGTDHRGISYSGTVTPVTDGADVTVTASVPGGTRLSADLSTEEPEEHRLHFHLDAAQLAGQQTKPLLLPGFGAADVRFAAR
jgi:hypothetical protein